MRITGFIIFLVIFLLFIEFFTLLFVNTGLAYDKARFQVISMLTSVGYTTRESEHILNHKRRRKIASWVMILGYVGNVTFVSFLITLIVSGKIPETIIIIIGIGAIIIFSMKNNKIINFIDKGIYFIIKRKIFGGMYVRYKTLFEGKEYCIYTIIMEKNNFLIGKTLMESRLMRDYEIQVLMVERKGHQINCPKPTYVFQDGDEITIYGRLKNIQNIFLK